MVGHTGVIPAAVAAVERVDSLVGDAVQAVKDVDGSCLICADHGNAEQMIDYTTGNPHTAHTTNPVPFILVMQIRLTDWQRVDVWQISLRH